MSNCDLEVGDVLLFGKENPRMYSFSWIVQHATGSKWTHSALVIDPQNLLVGESISLGFVIRKRINLYDKIEKGTAGVFRPDIPDSKKNLLAYKVHREYEKPYGFIDLLRLPFYFVTRKFWLPSTPNRWTCSEAVYRVLTEIGIKLPYRNPDSVTPGVLSDIIPRVC